MQSDHLIYWQDLNRANNFQRKTIYQDQVL